MSAVLPSQRCTGCRVSSMGWDKAQRCAVRPTFSDVSRTSDKSVSFATHPPTCLVTTPLAPFSTLRPSLSSSERHHGGQTCPTFLRTTSSAHSEELMHDSASPDGRRYGPASPDSEHRCCTTLASGSVSGRLGPGELITGLASFAHWSSARQSLWRHRV